MTISPAVRASLWVIAFILGALDVFTTFIDPDPNMVTYVVLACGILTCVGSAVAATRGRLWSLWMVAITRGVSAFFAIGAILGAPLVIKIIAGIVIMFDALVIYGIFSIYDLVRRTQESQHEGGTGP